MQNRRSAYRLLAILLPILLASPLIPVAAAAAPTITSLSPSSAVAGGAAFTLTITGTNFVSGATAKFGSTALTTTFVSATKLTAPIAASLIATASSVGVTVKTTGGTSAAATFTIKPAKPTITSLSPTSAVAGGAKFTLTVNGTHFTSTATAKWGATALTPTFVGKTQLTAPIAASLIASAGTASVTVTTAGGTSTAATFTIKPAKPTITSLSPTSAVAGGAKFTLTINGTHFTSTATAKWGATALTPTFVSATKLTAPIAASLIAEPGTASVTVTTAGGTSTAATFTINAGLPTITSLNPTAATAGGPAFTLIVNGTSFVSGAVVKWGATALTTTYKSAIQLTSAVPAALIATQGSASVTVTTPKGTSAAATFTITSSSGPACANDGAGNSKLKGVYSFQFSQVDPANNGELSLNAGAFTADGAGKITGGLLDANSPNTTSETQTAFKGTYSVGPDNRGLLTVTYTGGTTSNLCFALNSISSGISAGGRLVSDQTNEQVDSGAFYAQGASNPSVSSAKGSWAFGIQGAELAGTTGLATRGAEAGFLKLDGAGKVTAGELDLSQDKYVAAALTNSYKAQVEASGTYTLASSGRGTIALALAGGGSSNLVFYVAGPSQILLLSADPGGPTGSAVLAGRAYLRTASNFSNASLKGSSVAIGQAISNAGSAYYDERLIEAGIATWNGTGSYGESLDLNVAGNIALQQGSSGTYSVDAEGRATLNATSPSTFAYLVGPNQGFAVRGNPGVDFTYFENQTVPAGGFVAGSLDGAYSEGSVGYGFEKQIATSGVLTSNGAGDITGTIDSAPLLTGVVDVVPFASSDLQQAHAMDQSLSDTYSAAASGRFVVSGLNHTLEAWYLVSTTKAYVIPIDGAVWQPLEEIDHQ